LLLTENALLMIRFYNPRTLTLAVLLCWFSAVFAGNDQDRINWKDDQGRKQGHWIIFGKDRPEQGVPPEGKIEEGDYKDDRKIGIWIKYHNDGVTPRLKGEYDFGRPKGSFTKYYPNGKVQEEGVYDKGKYLGAMKRYYEDGTLMYDGNYDGEGLENGKIVYYYPNGKVEYEYTAKAGTPSGKGVRYWPNGDIKEEVVFDDSGEVSSFVAREMVNKPEEIKAPADKETKAAPAPKNAVVKTGTFNKNGYNKLYNENEELWMDGDFKNGLLYDGKLYVYDKDGILLKIEVYKKGKYHSDGQL
jgi:antitoxin component YwqK of YwqJK toxin-antitoxin module